MYVYAGGKSEEPTCLRFVVYFNLLCIEALNSIIILHILLGLQSLSTQYRARSWGLARSPRECASQSQTWSASSSASTWSSWRRPAGQVWTRKLQLAKNDVESWGKSDQGWVVRFLLLNNTWKALARAKVSLRAVCRESQTKARHSNGCRRVPPSPRSSGASFTTIIAKTLQERVSQLKPCLHSSTWCRRDLEPHS